MMNGAWFDDAHSYDDLNLILSNVDIPPAEAKTNYVDVPGKNGSADLTEASGRVRFKDRDIKLTFTVLPGDDFEQKKSEVSGMLNGRRCRIVLDKDPEWYWEGRCGIDSYASNRNVGQIVVASTVRPYKRRRSERRLSAAPGTAVKRSLPNGGSLAVVPDIETTAAASISFGGESYALEPGTHRLLNLELEAGMNVVTVTSDGTTTFRYREGEL